MPASSLNEGKMENWFTKEATANTQRIVKVEFNVRNVGK